MPQHGDETPADDDLDMVLRAFRSRMYRLLAACIALPILYFFYVAFIFSTVPSRWPALALIALPPAAALLFSHFHHRDQLALGRRLRAGGKHLRAAAAFTRAMDAGSMPAAALLGDMFLTGEGVEQDTEKALKHYGRALAIFENVCREDPPDTIPDAETLLREIAGRLEPLGRDGDARAVQLLVDAAFFLDDKPASLAWARALPDDGEPGAQAKCLGALLERKTWCDPDGIANMDSDGDSLPDPVKDIQRTPGTRMDSLKIIFMFVVLGYWLTLYLLNSPDAAITNRDLFALFVPPLLVGGVLFVLSRRDPFRIAKRLADRGRYRAALPHLRAAYEKMDPRAAKMLGDMHRHGLGTKVDTGKALAAYFRAFYYVQGWRDYHNRDGGAKSALFRPKVIAEFERDPDAYSAWEEELQRSVEALAASGAKKGFVLLGDFYTTLGDDQGALRCARQAFAAEPTAENEVTLATRLIFADHPTESNTAEGLAILERLTGAGDWMAASTLTRYYSSTFGRKEDGADRALAQRYFREMLDDWRPGAKYARSFAFQAKYGGGQLLEQYGADFLSDDDCLKIMRI